LNVLYKNCKPMEAKPIIIIRMPKSIYGTKEFNYGKTLENFETKLSDYHVLLIPLSERHLDPVFEMLCVQQVTESDLDLLRLKVEEAIESMHTKKPEGIVKGIERPGIIT